LVDQDNYDKFNIHSIPSSILSTQSNIEEKLLM